MTYLCAHADDTCNDADIKDNEDDSNKAYNDDIYGDGDEDIVN